MERIQATGGVSANSTQGADPTGREVMARQFAAASVDPTGRETMIRQCATKAINVSSTADQAA
jgi:hypothetical protein